MLGYIAKRLLQTIPLVFLISILCFALMHAIPGGPVGALAENPRASADDLARIRANFGLDRSLPAQYGMWLERVLLHGDFGRSYVTGEPVLRMILHRMPATLELMGSAFFVALLIGLPLGALPVLRRSVHLMAMMLFSVKLRLLPSAGVVTMGEAFSIVDHLRHLVLPTAALSLVFIASWSRYFRESLEEVLTENFIGVAKAKGLAPSVVVFKHALRNALAPVLTVVALNLPLLFTGAIIIETLFAWPGMGRLFYEGLVRMDYSRLMGIIFISSIVITLFNLLADVVYGILDPRIRYAR
jgi:peptide/nickel transport system permease protein